MTPQDRKNNASGAIGDASTSVEAVAQLVDDPSRQDVAHARLRLLERRAILALDGPQLAGWLELHERVRVEGPREELARALGRGWGALFLGSGAAEDLPHLEREAARHGRADLVIEAATLRALFASDEGDLEEATALARRASRMARVEGLPDPERLANLVLARVRRRTGSPHLAARILSALGRVAPESSRGWLAWELALAGERARALALLGELRADAPVSSRAAHALLSMLELPTRDSERRFRASAREAAELLRGCRFAQREAEELHQGIDPRVPLESLEGELRGWCAGVERRPPAALIGWCAEQDGGRAPAYVTSECPGAPRRLLGLGLGLLESPPVALAKSSGARRDTAMAVLLLAGREGLNDEAFFFATYGFELTSTSHRSALHVLKHRLRAQLPASARLVRIGERNVLEARAGLTVPDPRCGRRTTDRVLRALAGRGASAKEVAASLDIGVRTAQKVLQELVDDGSCLARKDGRRVTYVIEDTTFQEPTEQRHWSGP